MLRSILFWLAYAIGLDPRGLFVFFDGRRWRHADPMVLARRLWSISGFESDKSRELLRSDQGALKAQGFAEIARAVQKAFSVYEVEHGGLTEIECEALLDRFETYLGELKKNGSPGQTSAQFTVPNVSLDGLVDPMNAASVSG